VASSLTLEKSAHLLNGLSRSPVNLEAQNVLRRSIQSTTLCRAMSLSIALSPGGHLVVQLDDQAEPKLSQATVAHLGEAFSVSTTRGLETRASEFLHEPLPPTFVFWRGFAQRLFAALCHNSSLENASTIVISRPVETELTAMSESAPPMTGLEYLNSAILRRLWDELDAHVHAAIGRTPGGAAAYLKKCNPTWNAVGRATFHLAENKRNRAYPFGFLATYTNRVSEQGKVQHVPLGRALEEYVGAKNRTTLAALLSPVQSAAEQSKLARELLDSRAIFHPQVWRRDQAFAFLQNIPSSSKAAWSSAFRIGGRRPVHRGRKPVCESARPRETCSARKGCWISRWICRLRANR